MKTTINQTKITPPPIESIKPPITYTLRTLRVDEFFDFSLEQKATAQTVVGILKREGYAFRSFTLDNKLRVMRIK